MTDYLAWPVHATMLAEEKRALVVSLRGVADIVTLSPDGTALDLDNCDVPFGCELDEGAWASGLTAMRETMVASTGARLVLGGQVEGYRGSMPGVAEEVRLSLDANQPVYLLGGFGGCTRDIAESLGLVPPCRSSTREWEGRGWFAERKGYCPDNGLSREENCALAATPHIDEAVLLALTGMRQIELTK